MVETKVDYIFDICIVESQLVSLLAYISLAVGYVQ